MGIPPEIRAKIFEPFFTTKELGKGTGLGLSTVFSIIRGHNGFLKLESEIGKGTVFTVYFPASTQGTTNQPIAKPGAAPRGNGEGILVVDDEQSILRIAKETLEAFGYVVDTAASGIDALSLIADKPQGAISLVLTDYNMPGMNGAEVARQLRRFSPRIKIMVASGSIENLSQFKGIDVDEFLQKPFTADQMLECIHKLLQKK
jgi:CheY-like chemotaxis protein